MAYCRFMFIWAFVFLLGIVKSSPLISLSLIFFIEFTSKKSYMTKHKQYGLVLSELFFIVAILLKSRKLFIGENIFIFCVYLAYLKIFNVNVITLHKTHLKQDDITYTNENYWEYLSRIWKSFLFV